MAYKSVLNWIWGLGGFVDKSDLWRRMKGLLKAAKIFAMASGGIDERIKVIANRILERIKLLPKESLVGGEIREDKFIIQLNPDFGRNHKMNGFIRGNVIGLYFDPDRINWSDLGRVIAHEVRHGYQVYHLGLDKVGDWDKFSQELFAVSRDEFIDSLEVFGEMLPILEDLASEMGKGYLEELGRGRVAYERGDKSGVMKSADELGVYITLNSPHEVDSRAHELEYLLDKNLNSDRFGRTVKEFGIKSKRDYFNLIFEKREFPFTWFLDYYSENNLKKVLKMMWMVIERNSKRFDELGVNF